MKPGLAAGAGRDQSSPGRPRHFLVIPHRCVYFGDRDARSQVLHPLEWRSPAAYSDLARGGFRRTGGDLYRPRCGSCEACIPTRVAVERFRWGRRFRRVLKKNADLTVRAEPAKPDRESLDLYGRYIRGRHAGGEMYPPSPGQLLSMLQSDWAGTFFLSARLGGRLVSTAVTDTLDDGLAAVYTYFDPDLSGPQSRRVLDPAAGPGMPPPRPALPLPGLLDRGGAQDALQDRVPARATPDRRPLA